MRLINVAAGVLNQTPLDWDGNRHNIVDAIREARAAGVGLLCLPELCVTGYGCEDMFLSPAVEAMAWETLDEIEPQTAGIAVSVGLPVVYRNAVYNCAALIVDGELLGLAAKQHLAGDGLHYEPRWFKAWPAEAAAMVERGGRSIPIGDLYFDLGGVGVGFEICEDAWVADRPGGRLARKGIDVLLNPSASHFSFGKQEVRERYVLDGSRAFGVTYVYSNPLGNEAGRAIYGGGALIAAAGEMVAAGRRFSFRRRMLTAAVVDLDETRLTQTRLTSREPDVRDDPGRRLLRSFEWPAADPLPLVDDRSAWESGAFQKEEELARAVALGLFDYLCKSRSRGFVVSLSGGADSAAVACLVWLMVELVWRELGRDELVRRLPSVPGLESITAPRELVGILLTCVYQATKNSGDVTRAAARGVAEAIGARYVELDVEPLVVGYRRTVEEAIGRELSWERDDLTLQNIQARVRAPSAWMLANLGGAILLATSNRSEAAVGYATMDGDTAGGLSPIGGIDKAFLRRWLEWLETVGIEGIGPVPALSAVTSQAPTAELRPPDRSQTDEGDLMPYELLDAIEGAAIGEKKDPVETYRLIRCAFPQYQPDQLLVWIERFFTLWSRNQWKRERYAPSFHLDDRNLDPKTWCRFPILSGGYGRELEALREVVAQESGGGPDVEPAEKDRAEPVS